MPVYAAVSLDRTRIIYPGGAKSISINIRNNNKTLPYLAQAWFEDANGRKINTPFVVLPPVQRLEPEMESLLKLQALPSVKALPQDRESLFFFNMREVPPRSDRTNVLQLALQTRIKFFYRPEALAQSIERGGKPWQEKITLHQVKKTLRIENPTPYYISIVEAFSEDKSIPDFEPIMLDPYGHAVIPSSIGNRPSFSYIDDYGGRRIIKFKCESTCNLLPQE